MIRIPATLLALLACCAEAFAAAQSCDVLVYGGTPGGIAAAISAARDGAKVVLIEPTRHVGGLVSSGLTHTDYRTFEGLTGAFLDFSHEVEAYYRNKYGVDSAQVKDSWRGTQMEPSVAELIFERQLAAQKSLKVRKGLELATVQSGAAKDGLKTIQSASFSIVGKKEREEFSAKIFIDATYEGDLLAMAGAAFRVGREGKAEFGESLAPDQPDQQLQAYNFRFCMTQNPNLRVLVSKPEGYRREDFVEMLPLIKEGKILKAFGYPSKCLVKAQLPRLPNGKYDINDVSNGLVRLSMPGENLEWPNGDAKTRAKIFRHHLAYNVGLIWFVQNDEAVPEDFRKEALTWGWSKDEFTDNGNLPWQLYVREARRLEGRHIFTERDTDAAPNDARSVYKADSIGFGDYGPNCHGTSHTGPRHGGKHTGEFYKRVAPYQIPYGTLLPKEVDNLLVPVAASSSHVGFCALRLEPIWMSLGQAAGVAARVAVAEKTSPASLAVPKLQSLLHAEGAGTIYVSDVLPGAPLFAAVQWIAARGGLHGLSAPEKEYGTRGKNIEGQYYEAFPGHAFEAEEMIDGHQLERWISFLPEAKRQAAAELTTQEHLTRGDAAAAIYKLIKDQGR